MTRIRFHGRFYWLALIAAVCTVIAGHQTSSAQDSPEYIQFLEERSMLYQANHQADSISGEGVQ